MAFTALPTVHNLPHVRLVPAAGLLHVRLVPAAGLLQVSPEQPHVAAQTSHCVLASLVLGRVPHPGEAGQHAQVLHIVTSPIRAPAAVSSLP